MTEERWQRLRTYYHESLDLTEAHRKTLLSMLQGSDPELHAELVGLLAERPEAGFLEDDLYWPGPEETPAVPDRLGVYRLVREIGQGGMGIVFEAVREEPDFRKTVAVKILTASVLDRASAHQFRVERKALGELCHPNIAQLLDWGETADRHAYLVMEYVADAQPIDVFCRTHALRASEIAQLIIEVCDAVAHAHSHLVIHGDLKPANILVTPDGRVKLLDFGVAKLLDVPEGGTRSVLRRLTPAYAAPEQIVGDSSSTASDIYSLGVLAYQLLTGCSPYGDDLRPGQIIWAVVNQSPKPPAEVPTISPDRRRELRGDLEKILFKSLEKEPSRRYSSVEALANDLRNYLAGQPVSAQGSAWTYRASKFLRRHWIALAACLLAMLSLAAGGGIAAWKARAAMREKASAEVRLRELQELSHSLIFDLHDSITFLPGGTRARAAILSTAVRYLDWLDRQDGADERIKLELAAAHQKIAELQHQPFNATFADPESARKNYDTARPILLHYWKMHPYDPYAGDLLLTHGSSALLNLDPAAVVEEMQEDVTIADAWVQARPEEPRALYAAALLHQIRGQIRIGMGDLSGSLQDAEVSGRLAERYLRYRPADWRVYFLLSVNQFGRGWVLTKMGAVREALAAYDSADENLRRANQTKSANVRVRREFAIHESRRSGLLLAEGRISEANAAILRALKSLQELADAESPNYNAQRDLAIALVRHGRVLIALNRPTDALHEFEEAVNIFSELPRLEFTSSFLHAEALNELGVFLINNRPMRDLDRSEQVLRAARDLAERDLRSAPGDTELLHQRARTYYELGRMTLIRSKVSKVPAGDASRLRGEAALMFQRSLDDWQLFHQRSPLYREDKGIEVAARRTLASLQ